MGDDHDGPLSLGQAAQYVHDSLVQAGVETRGRFVEEEQGRPGEQLHSNGGPLTLTAGESGHRCVGVLLDLVLTDVLLDPAGAFRCSDVDEKPQQGCIFQRLAHRELRVDHVVLGHDSDPVPQMGVVAVRVAAVVDDPATAWRRDPGEHPQEGRRARTRQADDRRQTPGPTMKEISSRSRCPFASSKVNRSADRAAPSPIATLTGDAKRSA